MSALSYPCPRERGNVYLYRPGVVYADRVKRVQCHRLRYYFKISACIPVSTKTIYVMAFKAWQMLTVFCKLVTRTVWCFLVLNLLYVVGIKISETTKWFWCFITSNYDSCNDVLLWFVLQIENAYMIFTPNKLTRFKVTGSVHYALMFLNIRIYAFLHNTDNNTRSEKKDNDMLCHFVNARNAGRVVTLKKQEHQ